MGKKTQWINNQSFFKGDEIKPTSQGTSGNVSGAMRSEEQPRFEASGGHSSRSQWEEGIKFQFLLSKYWIGT